MTAGEFFCAVRYNVSGLGHSEIFVSGTRLKEVIIMKFEKYESYSNRNIKNGSQTYKEVYGIDNNMKRLDMSNKKVYNAETWYHRNPSAKNLKEAFSDDKFFESFCEEEEDKITRLLFVIAEDRNIIVGKRSGLPHPALIGGKDPKVRCAGILELMGPKIYSVSNQSGHYKPDIKSLAEMENALRNLYEAKPHLFHERLRMGEAE